MRYFKGLILLAVLVIVGFVVASVQAQIIPQGGGSSGGGTTITAGAGDFSGCTQTGASLNCTVTKSSGNLFTSTTFGAALNISTLLSQDCTVGATGVMTCTKAGNGTGGYQVGSLGVGVAASGTAGQISLPNGSDNTKIGDIVNGTYIQISSASSSDFNFFMRGHTDILLEDGSNNHHSVTLSNGLAFQSTGGTAPTLTAGCNGAGSSVTAGSTNNRGQFTTQTAAATTCTLTFSAAGTFQQNPFCIFTDGQAQITPKAYSEGTTNTTTTTVDFVSASNAVIAYMCM